MSNLSSRPQASLHFNTFCLFLAVYCIFLFRFFASAYVLRMSIETLCFLLQSGTSSRRLTEIFLSTTMIEFEAVRSIQEGDCSLSNWLAVMKTQRTVSDAVLSPKFKSFQKFLVAITLKNERLDT